MKEILNKIVEKIKESRVFKFIKNTKNKITTNMNDKTSNVGKASSRVDDFINNHNNIVKNAMIGNLLSRFHEIIQKPFKWFRKTILDKNENSNTVSKIGKFMIRAICVLLLIAFIGIVIYYIKDVFINCLLLVATCAAVVVCIEFILMVLSTAIGQKI